MYIYITTSHQSFSLLVHVSKGMVNWSKHLKHEDPDFSPTFQRIIATLAHFFDVEVYATRLNFYRNGADWKPFHHDSHAYGGKDLREDFTMGASFGASRDPIRPLWKIITMVNSSVQTTPDFRPAF